MVIEAQLHARILDILARHRLMAMATNRPDGWPQTTTVGYVNVGLTLYFWSSPESQKVENIRRDQRVSLAIHDDVSDPMAINGLSMAAYAEIEVSPAVLSKAASLLYEKYPEYGPFRAFELDEIVVFRLTPKVISVIDYTNGFGHVDLVVL